MTINKETVEYRKSASKGRDTPFEVLVELAKDENDEIRYNVADNENTPPESLSKLSADENCHVRMMVAGNKNTPIEILKALSFDEDSDVRATVSWNKRTPLNAIHSLVEDDDLNVRKSAIKTISELSRTDTEAKEEAAQALDVESLIVAKTPSQSRMKKVEIIPHTPKTKNVVDAAALMRDYRTLRSMKKACAKHGISESRGYQIKNVK